MDTNESQQVVAYDEKQKQMQAYQTHECNQVVLHQANMEQQLLISELKQIDDTTQEYERKTKELIEKKNWFLNETMRLVTETHLKREKKEKCIQQINIAKKTILRLQEHVLKLQQEKDLIMREREEKRLESNKILDSYKKRNQEQIKKFESMGNWSKYRELEQECKKNQAKLETILCLKNDIKEKYFSSINRLNSTWKEFKRQCVEIAEVYVSNQKTMRIIETNLVECINLDVKIQKLEEEQEREQARKQMHASTLSKFSKLNAPANLTNYQRTQEPFVTPKVTNLFDTLNDLMSFPFMNYNTRASRQQTTQIKTFEIKKANVCELPYTGIDGSTSTTYSQMSTTQNDGMVTQITTSQQSFKTPLINNSINTLDSFDTIGKHLHKSVSPQNSSTVSNSKITIVKASSHKMPIEASIGDQASKNFTNDFKQPSVKEQETNALESFKNLHSFSFNHNFSIEKSKPLINQFKSKIRSTNESMLPSDRFNSTTNTNETSAAPSANNFVSFFNFTTDSNNNAQQQEEDQIELKCNFFD